MYFQGFNIVALWLTLSYYNDVIKMPFIALTPQDGGSSSDCTEQYNADSSVPNLLRFDWRNILTDFAFDLK